MKRTLMPICIVLAVLIIFVSITTVSFSWFAPGSESGIGLKFTADTSVRSQNCSFTTYEGTNNSGIIVYENAPVGISEVTVEAEDVAYFKTVIHNDNEKYDTNVSLYLPSFTVSGTEPSASIGVATPTSIMADTFGTGKLSEEKIVEIIRKEFDLRPDGIIKMLDLRRPIYKQTAAYGHFGRTDIELPWEKTDKADVLKDYL